MKAAARRQVMAMATEADGDPLEVLMKTIRVAWGAVPWLQEQIADIDPDEGNTKLFIAYQQLYGEWTERAARFSKMALDAGVAERQVRVVERQGELVAQVIKTILDGLQLTKAQRSLAPQLVRTALLQLEAAT
ncbi:hypothetical protein GTQ99_00495 [Kineococcus sp. T13]|uniref:hypothetical protein n=1 Tax=Kineococcus vitellinus TaxID=2696565 RepID=UPI001411D360|nr:hypothetical protein [Kineococcus vitellinus]NAZ73910.1 hypothetical protein [Kineococcus vitellinus]